MCFYCETLDLERYLGSNHQDASHYQDCILKLWNPLLNLSFQQLLGRGIDPRDITFFSPSCLRALRNCAKSLDRADLATVSWRGLELIDYLAVCLSPVTVGNSWKIIITILLRYLNLYDPLLQSWDRTQYFLYHLHLLLVPLIDGILGIKLSSCAKYNFGTLYQIYHFKALFWDRFGVTKRKNCEDFVKFQLLGRKGIWQTW